MYVCMCVCMYTYICLRMYTYISVNDIMLTMSVTATVLLQCLSTAAVLQSTYVGMVVVVCIP